MNLFFTQNFYIDLFSNSDEFPNELYFIINKLINDLISDLSKITDFSEMFEGSNLAYLLDGIILNNKIRSFFNLILSDIIEKYENSKENRQLLLFQIKDIKNFFINQENYLASNNSNNIANYKKKQNTILNKIYRMKIPNVINEISMNESSFIEFDYDDNFAKDYKNNEIFANKYLQEINKNDIIGLLNKEKNELIKNYIRNQLTAIENDNSIYSTKNFLGKIQKEEASEKILFYYQRSFMVAIKIIKKIFKKLNEYIEIIPQEIKNISIMIMQSLKNKYNWISANEIYKYISEFFMRIFKAFFLYPDYNAFINSVILSQNTKHNLFVIFDIILKLMRGDFYKNSEKDECDMTPFNLFFLEILPNVYNFYEKLLDKSNYNLKMENIEYNIYNDLNNKKNINSVSIIYSVHQLTSIIKIINDNYDKLFLDKKQSGFEKDELMIEFLKVLKKLMENMELFNKIKEDQNIIYFFSYNEILYSEKILDMINRNKNKYFKINELIGDKTTEEVNLNKIIRAKNLIFDLLYISPKLYKLSNIATNSKGKNTKEILTHLNKYFKGINNFTENNNIDNSLNNNEKSKIPKDWYINSLMVCLENLDNEYSKNDYEKFYESIEEDLNNSIKNYEFGQLGQILRDLKTISIYKNKFINLQEKIRDITINLKIRNIIENEPIEVFIHFIYNSNQKIFNITKIENNNNNKNNKSNNKNINNKLLIKCLTINDFIKKFPNLSLIQQRQDIDLFLIEREINLSRGLNQYFDILKYFINIRFNKEEINIVYNKIQKYILIKIYDKIYPRESDKDDMIIFQKTILLSWIRPHHLKLDKTYLDNFIPITSKYINQLDKERSPNGKFNIINKIFNAINNVLKFNKGCSFSIDDIAPICEYCFIKAQPERLSSNIKYLKNFISNEGSDLRKMRFDILKSCMNSIKEINYEKFEGVSKEEYDKLCIMARGMPIK